MSFNAFANSAAVAVSARSRQMLGCAAIALAIGAFVPAAQAADECGVVVAGAVTCVPAGNPYGGGITYGSLADITVTAPTGIVVLTQAPVTNGIVIASTGAATLAGAAAVSTSGAASNGVVVTGVGPVSVSTGAVSTSGLNATGIIALSSAGATTVNAGPVTVSGLGGRGIFARGTGPVSVASRGASTVDMNAITAWSLAGPAAVTLASGSVHSGSADGIVITGTTANLTTSAGTSVFGGANGVTLVAANSSSVSNSGTIGGGVYAVSASGGPATITNTGSGTINGAVSLLGSGALVDNAAIFNALGTSTFGTVSRFNNTGTLAVGSASLVPVAANLAGLTTFSNTGLVTMVNGHAGDTLGIAGNYVGSGNALLAVDLTPTSADRLIIGGSASGSTAVSVVPVGGLPQFNTGTVIVQAGAGSTPGAFGVAAGSVNAGLVRYDVTYNPLNTSYSIVAAPSDAAYNMLTFGTAERNLWNKSADAISVQMQSRRDALWSMGGTAPAGKFWMTMAGSNERVRGSRDFSTLGQVHVTDTGYSQDYYGGQMGLGLSGGAGERGGFSVGITGGYINSRVKLGGSADRVDFNAANGGAYASFTSGNVFINALGKYDRYWADAASPGAGYRAKLKGSAYGARGEIGLRFGGDSFFVEPVAQISYLHTSLDSFTVQGTNVRFDDRDGLHGKAGARIGGVTDIGGGAKMSYYAGANYVHDFKDEGRVSFTNAGGTYNVGRYRMPDYGEAVAGFTIASSSAVSGFIEGTYTRTFKNDVGAQARLSGVGGRAGINFKF